MRKEGYELLDESECRCRYWRKVYNCSTIKMACLHVEIVLIITKKILIIRTSQAQLSFQVTWECGMVGTLGIWKYDRKVVRLMLSKMIILDELTFKFIESVEFRIFMSTLCPKFVIPSRWTIWRDVYQLYLDKKLALKVRNDKTSSLKEESFETYLLTSPPVVA